jgi:tRNA threonylcarbamoyladenosine biosynthesis protein TsaE
MVKRFRHDSARFLARLNDSPKAVPDQRADNCPHEGDHRQLGGQSTFVRSEREKPNGDENGFKGSGNDRDHNPGDDSDDYVVGSPEHRMTHSRLRAESLAEFEEIARQFARGLRPGDVVALSGPLGAGKTTFVAAVVTKLHGDRAAVSSPTFTFWHRYEGTPPINHLDLYRIEEPGEVVELGLEEAFSEDAITLVEWAERAPGLFGKRCIRVGITGAGNAIREAEITE